MLLNPNILHIDIFFAIFPTPIDINEVERIVKTNASQNAIQHGPK